MVSDIPLDFLRDRIHEIRSALFANNSNEAFKLPTCIITALNIDSEGNLCFFIPRPEMYIDEYDKEFPASLDFFRKGIPYFVKVFGQAHIVTDLGEVHAYMGLPGTVDIASLAKLLLVKVKIEHTEYFEAKLRRRSPKWREWKELLRQLVFREKPQSNPAYSLHPTV